MRNRYIFIGIIIAIFMLASIAIFSRFVPTAPSVEQRLAECGSLPNGNIENVTETTRMFINIPRDVYPGINLEVTGQGAAVGSVSNGGEYGYALGAEGRPNCWSYYFEFNGNGTVDMVSRSGKKGIPDYVLHFIVSSSTSGVESSWNATSSSDAIWRYPSVLQTQYVSTVDWPPQLQLIDEPFACVNAGSVSGRAGKTERITVNGDVYCRTEIIGAAAGSVYTQYAYAFPEDERTAIFTFTLRSVQCGNYSEPEAGACRKEQTAFNIDPLLDNIRRTLVWK